MPTEEQLKKMADLAKKLKSKSKYSSRIKSLGQAEEDYNPDDYFDTGNYMLNLLTSGDWKKGMPSNVSIQLLGKSDTGKSFFGKIFIHDAFEKGYLPVLIETEGGIMAKELYDMGFTKDTFQFFEPKHVKQASSMIQDYVETASRDDKFIVLFDSIGNMPSTEEYGKRNKDDASPTMGKKAQEVYSMFRVLKKEAFLKNKPLIFVNREFQKFDTGMYTSEEEKNQTGGGDGNDYAPSITLKFKKKYIKERYNFRDENNKKKSATKVIGNEFIVVIKKSRFVWSNSYCVLRQIDGKMSKYSGLWRELTQSPFYEFDGKRKGDRDLFIYDENKKLKKFSSVKNEDDVSDEIWDKLLENGFGDWLKKRYRLPKDNYGKYFKNGE